MLTRTDIRRRSLRSRIVTQVLRWRLKPKLTSEQFDPARFRLWLDRENGRKRTAPGVEIQPANDSPVPGEWNIPEDAKSDTCVLYLHGGGYLFGSPLSYRSFTTQLARRSGMRLFVPDYRLAPEHPFPAAVDDALAVYRWLLDRGIPASGIVLAGDSAGGGLALALVHALQQHGLPTPAALIALSPYTDLLTTGESLQANGKSCAMFNAGGIQRAASRYLAGADGGSPLASPLYGDFVGCPPLLIYVSDTEALRDDALRVAERAAAAGVAVDLRVWRAQPHVWPIFYPLLPEADRTIVEMATFATSAV